jgi:4-diphosphocytidyl-2C-methyl-D-erythritol kinase
VAPTLARFAPAKVNLFLEVLGRRPDGFHEIVTVMETIAAGDLVEAAPARELEVVADRADVPSGEGNVAWKIVRAAEAALGRPLPARITDTAFFLDGGLALCTGRGENVRRLTRTGVRHLVLVLPARACATATVYGALEISGSRRDPAAIVATRSRSTASRPRPNAPTPTWPRATPT